MGFIRNREPKGPRELEHEATILNRCRMQTYWMRQGFVKEFLDGYLKGNDIASLRDQFDRDLELYVATRCAEKLEQASQLVSEIEELELKDPFSGVRASISKYKGAL